MDMFKEAVDAISGFLWSPYMCALFALVGLIISFRTGFFQLTKIRLWWKKTIGSATVKEKNDKGKNTISQFQAAASSLAATLGTGNIAGVATAIVSGGPGAVFWMWISALLGMATKFAEIGLAVKYKKRRKDGGFFGGPFVYLRDGVKSKTLAVIYALGCSVAAFGVGCLTQSNSIAGAIENAFNIKPVITGAVIAMLTFIVMAGGIKRLGKVSEAIVPFMAIAYVVGGVIVMAVNYKQIPAAFGSIFSCAFGLKSAVGGVMGYTVSRAMRFGVARGICSNEAGMGTASIAHVSADTESPVGEAMWGCFEVFVDTILTCSITAICILVTGVYNIEGMTGIDLTIKAFSSAFGNFSAAILAVMVALFAFTSIISWGHYGRQSLGFILGKDAGIAYNVIFAVFIVIGSVMDVSIVWSVADIFNSLMSIPNLIGLIIMSDEVSKMTREYLKKVPKPWYNRPTLKS